MVLVSVPAPLCVQATVPKDAVAPFTSTEPFSHRVALPPAAAVGNGSTVMVTVLEGPDSQFTPFNVESAIRRYSVVLDTEGKDSVDVDTVGYVVHPG